MINPSSIKWYDLNGTVVVKLNSKFQSKLLHLLIEKAETVDNLANKIQLNRHHISLYKNQTSNFSVSSLRRICEYLHLNPSKLNKHILELGRKKKKIVDPKLPFNLNAPEGVALRSIVNSEGCIHPGKGTTLRIKVPEKDMLVSTIKFAHSVFGNSDIEIQKTKDRDTYEIYLTSLIADCLKLAGVPGGKKSVLNHHVPSDILNGRKELQKIYLGWSFACEMECSSKVIKLCRYVSITDLLNKKEIAALHEGMNFRRDLTTEVQNKVTLRPPNLLADEALMLRKFGINRPLYFSSLWKSKDRRKISAKWAIVISNFDYMKKLLKLGIPLPEKEEKIRSVLRTYKTYLYKG